MNYFVARHYTSRDMNWLHCCWGIGASAGPLMITLILSAGWSWRCGYGIVSAVQLCLAGLFLMTLNLWKETGTGGGGGRAEAFEGKVRYSLRFFCCPLMMFLYCGAEYSLGLWGYLFLTQCRGYSPEAAGYAVTGYWGMLTFGRFLLGFIANRLGNTRQIRFSTLLGLAGAVLLLSDLPFLPAAALGLIGFAFATFYPAMMHATPERFDDATAATVIGYQGGAGHARHRSAAGRIRLSGFRVFVRSAAVFRRGRRALLFLSGSRRFRAFPGMKNRGNGRNPFPPIPVAGGAVTGRCARRRQVRSRSPR